MNPLMAILGGAKAAGSGAWTGLKRLFGLGGAGAAGGVAGSMFGGNNNDQQNQDQNGDGTPDSEQLPQVENVEPTPNITPLQQLNTTSSALIAPMEAGGTVDEKLDYIVNSIGGMRNSLATLVAAVRGLSLGQSAINSNVSTVANRPNKPGFFGNMFRTGITQGGLGVAAALGIGVGGAALGGMIGSGEANTAVLADVGAEIDKVTQGEVTPENTALYTAVQSAVYGYGLEAVGTTIDSVIENDTKIASIVEGLQSRGIEVDTSKGLTTLLDAVKSIPTNAPTETIPSEDTTVPQIQSEPLSTEPLAAPAATIESPEQQQIPPAIDQGNTGAVLENSTASPSIQPPFEPSAPDNGAVIEDEFIGETEEDELGIQPQSLNIDQIDMLQPQQITGVTRSIMEKSQAPGPSTIVTPIVLNNNQQQTSQMPAMSSGGSGKSSILTVAYRTPADTRTYSQDNFTSV